MKSNSYHKSKTIDGFEQKVCTCHMKTRPHHSIHLMCQDWDTRQHECATGRANIHTMEQCTPSEFNTIDVNTFILGQKALAVRF